MALNLNALLSTTANLIEKNKTTVNSGLNSEYKSIHIGVQGMHENYPVPKTLYPTIFVELVRKDEDFEQLGQSARRATEIGIQIVPVTEYGIGINDARAFAAKEIITLTQNIETVFRENVSMSTTVDWVLIESTNYSGQVRDETYNHVAVITLKVNKRTL